MLVIERICWWIAFHLPRKIVYYAIVRAGVHATTGRWGHLLTPETTLIEVLNRWEITDNRDPP